MALHDLITVDRQYLSGTLCRPACGPLQEATGFNTWQPADSAATATNAAFCAFSTDLRSPTMQLTPLACDDCALMQTMWEHLLDAAGGVPKLTVQVQEFVCQHLAWRGYRKAEAWLHASSSVTATSLLVALAWFIGRCQLFQLYPVWWPSFYYMHGVMMCQWARALCSKTAGTPCISKHSGGSCKNRSDSHTLESK